MLTEDHKTRKLTAYWDDLVGGDTSQYKEAVLDHLITTYMPDRVEAILDIGCGTSDIAFKHRDRLKASKFVCADYDAAIVERMRAEHAGQNVEWRVGDIFVIDQWEDRFDLVFLLDMIHEIYSFYGRASRETPGEIDHERGGKAVRDALASVARIVRPGGGIAITDNVLTAETGPVAVRMLTPQTRAAVERFLSEYPSRRMKVERPQEDVIVLAAHDFCILLTQYNKIKTGQEHRWRVEQLEIHQYLDEEGYRRLFDELGFDLHCVIGTPKPALDEWRSDFEVLSGLPDLPPKRVTLLATKRFG